MYSKKILKLFFHPKFFGKIKNPDAVGTAGNPVCGDVLTFYLKIAPPETGSRAGVRPGARAGTNRAGTIKEISYETLGCSAAISVSEVISRMAKGKTIEEASKISFQDVLKELGKLPPNKLHCTYLGIDALQEAINNYNANLRMKC